MVSFVCFLWNDGFRNYKAEQINMLARAVARFYQYPHRFICVTDVTRGFSPEVEVLPIPKAAQSVASLEAPQGKNFPSSYRRLWCFSQEAVTLGERIMLLDVDCMVVGDLAPLFEIDADFVGWRPITIWGREDRIGGGTWLLKTGKLPWLWENFKKGPTKMIQETKAAGWNGSDQAILSRFLHAKYPTWPQMCGIYGSQDGVFQWEMPPAGARIIHFNGDGKPWGQDKLWIRAYCNYFGGAHAAEKRKIQESNQC